MTSMGWVWAEKPSKVDIPGAAGRFPGCNYSLVLGENYSGIANEILQHSVQLPLNWLHQITDTKWVLLRIKSDGSRVLVLGVASAQAVLREVATSAAKIGGFSPYKGPAHESARNALRDLYAAAGSIGNAALLESDMHAILHAAFCMKQKGV
jgi:hypothetical protein